MTKATKRGLETMGSELSSDSGIRCARIEVISGEAVSDDLEVALRATPVGAFVPESTRIGETKSATLGASELQLVVGRRTEDVGEGDIVVPMASDGVVGWKYQQPLPVAKPGEKWVLMKVMLQILIIKNDINF